MATDTNKYKTRKRMSTDINKTRDKIRKKAARYLKNKSRRFTGWTRPDEKNMVVPVVIEKLDIVCIDWGALMFSWEIRKKKEGGFTFSLCCSYGTIELNMFRDPPPILKGCAHHLKNSPGCSGSGFDSTMDWSAWLPET